MASVRQHFSEVHGRLATFHAASVTSHQKRALQFNKLAGHYAKTETTEAEKDTKAILEALADLHQEMSVEHGKMADFHKSAAESCAKVADGELEKLVPMRVSAVAPDVPAGVRAVIRTGSRTMPTEEPPRVDLELQHLVKIDG